jgi:hypothetical protein
MSFVFGILGNCFVKSCNGFLFVMGREDDCKNPYRAYTESTVLYLYDFVTGFSTDRRDKDRCVHTCARYKGGVTVSSKKNYIISPA